MVINRPFPDLARHFLPNAGRLESKLLGYARNSLLHGQPACSASHSASAFSLGAVVAICMTLAPFSQ